MTEPTKTAAPEPERLDGIARAIRDVARIQGTFSSGGAIIDTLNMLRGDGIEPVGAICVIDRETGGVENLANVGFELNALLTMSRIESA